MTLFLDGLLDEYKNIQEALFANPKLEQSLILLRLQQRELKANKSNGSRSFNDSANRARRPLIYWNCGGEGHKADDCKKPKKEDQQD